MPATHLLLTDISWPDLVLRKMQTRHSTSDIAVLNQAAGGNRILYDGLGPNALSRIDRDVLAHSGIEYAMIFEGVNDIGTGATDAATQKAIGDRLIAAFTQIAIRIKTFDIPIFAATITPFSAPGYNITVQGYSDPEREKTRQRVNEWIRKSGTFDEVLDFYYHGSFAGVDVFGLSVTEDIAFSEPAWLPPPVYASQPFGVMRCFTAIASR